jgi:hypothetical protein
MMPPMARKLLWFVALYLASVLLVACVAYGLRALLFR